MRLLQVLAAAAAVALVAAGGWAFFRMNMAVHPLVRACFVRVTDELSPEDPPALLEARFEQGAGGAQLVLVCGLPDGKGGAVTSEYRFLPEQDPGKEDVPAGANPFEDGRLSVRRVQTPQGTVTLASPVPCVTPPALMRSPSAVVTAVREGRPCGPEHVTVYSRSAHFFRYSDRTDG